MVRRLFNSEEQPRALETAGGLISRIAAPCTRALCGGQRRHLYEFPFETLELASDQDAHLVLVPNPPEHPLGDFGLEQGLARPAAASQYTFSGIAMYRCEFFLPAVPTARSP